MEAQSNIKVFCRFRPLNEKELQISHNYCVNFLDEQTLSVKAQYDNAEPLRFTFDRVFSPAESQESVYNVAAKPIINAVMQGFNGTVLAYGQTSSGKTFTMSGRNMEEPELMGIIPRMIITVFEQIAEADEWQEFSVKVAYFEIYLEKLRDLIDSERCNLKIHEDRARGVYIEGLSEHYVSDEQGVFDLMRMGMENREIGSTNMNSGSSRSHSIFVVTVSQTNSKDFSGKTGRLFLVDLAGSEKIAKTGAAGKRLEEAKNINKSLTVLGQVIFSLTDSKTTHVPYRNSKLTRVLQDSLGGNSKTSLITTCSPSAYNESETVSTLRFGIRAKAIKNSPKINKEYTVAELKLMLAKAQEELESKDKIISRLEGHRAESAKIEVIELKDFEKNPKIACDEVMDEIEELRLRLNEESDNVKALADDNRNLLGRIKHLESENAVMRSANLGLKESNLILQQRVKEQEGLIEKLLIAKEALESDNENFLRIKISFEQLINEKELEIQDLKQHFPGNVKKTSEIVCELRGIVEFEREKNQDLTNKLKTMESTLESNMQLLKSNGASIQEALIQQSIEKEKKKWDEERKSIIRDLKNRINKVIELEIALDNAKENYEALENTLSLGEKKLKQKTDLLTKNLEQLTCYYKQLLSEKATTRVDLKVIERKNTRLVERNFLLEEEIQKLRKILEDTESKLKALEDEIYYINHQQKDSSNFSYKLPKYERGNIKKTIKGGVGGSSSRMSYVCLN